jgi:uncharacterized membrane protein YphA (DoxX/SURF4 family)
MLRKEKIVDICRWVLGGVFSFSGIVKCVDPVGTSVFVEKYLATFSLDVFLPLALPIAIALSVVEFALGQLLLCGKPHRITAVVIIVIMSLFTVVTLLNATILPIGDCGCFGDAVRLTPLETLIKNIILLPLSVLMLRDSKCGRFNYLGAATAVVIALGVCLYSLRHQPLIDFMPYREGVDLRSEIVRERELEKEQTTTHLVFHTADGTELLFPATDVECWLRDDIVFVESRTETSIAEPLPFAEFIITNSQGDDVTLELLASHADGTFVAVASLDALRGRRLEAFKQLLASGEDVVVLTSADVATTSQILGVESYGLDAMTLRTLNRSRVGVVRLEDGVIVHKCDIRDL